MKRKQKGFAAGFAVLTLVTALVMGLVCYYHAVLPERFLAGEGKITIASRDTLSVRRNSAESVDAGVVRQRHVGADTASVRLWGMIPVKTVEIHAASARQMQIGGSLFGIKLYTDGVLVVNLDRITTRNGRVSPGRQAGLKVGDSILSANGRPLSTNEELREIISTGNGAPVSLQVRRDETVLTLSLTPVQSTAGVWRGGIWVRDSTAGIGTLTCFDEQSGAYVGLGHGIYDVDAGTLLPVGEGEICKAILTGVIKGKAGTPGQIEGGLTDGAPHGNLLCNTESGIGGILDARELMEVQESASFPLAYRQEVQTGKAYLCSRLEGSAMQLFEVRIEKVDLTDGKKSKNLIVRVTDERLLEKTGGIVQGMSGSPLIQNGKLIGAVTHVFVGDPSRGYGIFIENMLDAAA